MDSSSSLSEDLLIQILVYLPVVSLLRFKSVSKSWLALIENSDFINLHATTLPPNNSSKFATFIFLDLIRPYSRTKRSNIFMLSGDDDNETFEDLFFLKKTFEDLTMPTLTYVDDDADSGEDLPVLLGSCNGIVCLHHEINNSVTLWNLVKSIMILLHLVLMSKQRITRWYELVLIFRNHVTMAVVIRLIRVQVYNLSTDSWRFIEDITSLTARPYEQTFMSHGMYLNGSYFVLGLKGFNEGVLGLSRRSVILSFDFTEETFTTMQLPNQAANPLTLICLDGKIALMGLADKYDSQFITYNIWLLNESGVKESWTRLYSIGPVYRGVDTPRGIFRILKNGEFAILSVGFSYGWKLQLFNIVTKEVKDLRTDYGEVIRSHVNKESLVPISRNGAGADDRVIGGAL